MKHTYETHINSKKTESLGWSNYWKINNNSLNFILRNNVEAMFIYCIVLWCLVITSWLWACADTGVYSLKWNSKSAQESWKTGCAIFFGWFFPTKQFFYFAVSKIARPFNRINPCAEIPVGKATWHKIKTHKSNNTSEQVLQLSSRRLQYICVLRFNNCRKRNGRILGN